MNIKTFEKQAKKATALLRSMSNEKRLMILCLLTDGELSVSQLIPMIGLSQSALSQHLAILRQRGLVETRRESQTIHYSLADPNAASILETLYGIFCPPGFDPPAAETGETAETQQT